MSIVAVHRKKCDEMNRQHFDKCPAMPCCHATGSLRVDGTAGMDMQLELESALVQQRERGRDHLRRQVLNIDNQKDGSQ